MDTLMIIAQLVGAALAGAGILKGGTYAVEKFRGPKENEPKNPVSQEICNLKNSALNDKLDNISEDLNEVKTTMNKIVELQLEVVRIGSKIDLAKEEIKSEIKEVTHEVIERHQDKYHSAA